PAFHWAEREAAVRKNSRIFMGKGHYSHAGGRHCRSAATGLGRQSATIRRHVVLRGTCTCSRDASCTRLRFRVIEALGRPSVRRFRIPARSHRNASGQKELLRDLTPARPWPQFPENRKGCEERFPSRC